MLETKRCAQCNTENPLDVMYCIKCRKFFSTTSRTKDNRKIVTVWDFDGKQGGQSEPSVAPNNIKQPDLKRRVGVICPQCKTFSEAPDDVIPITCETCGYYFQVGIDIPVLEPIAGQKDHDTTKGNNVKATTEQAEENNAGPNKPDKQIGESPMRRVSADRSEMRLIPLTAKGRLPENVEENGGLIGANGTLLKWISTQQQINIWHAQTGWYAMILQGRPLYNGVPYNVRVQIKLNNGDVFSVENELIRVEII